MAPEHPLSVASVGEKVPEVPLQRSWLHGSRHSGKRGEQGVALASQELHLCQ